jgi:hypothetical protein
VARSPRSGSDSPFPSSDAGSSEDADAVLASKPQPHDKSQATASCDGPTGQQDPVNLSEL